ncbi:MAG: alpha/beta fold hydrolase [Thermogemmatispora sp.]|jgi:pimeloyl-ACP methyl ester carboxylesterase|uniref:Alpha/beta hydrolase n=1 Tax=Thermogemmatispora aurantia TaxID=2045279 RepID=A0A5J4K343_9CHLR|nr:MULTISPECIES: alpha/beta fold hydrolase [Thermogemmatispora]MBE3565337.1 alpha/beta fold hydrolase [Thermogemmatispora sp.]GER81572.1 alpha/beta hydrolase [Thermogemmatispora aurantia]
MVQQPIVFLHGAGGSARSWSALLEYLGSYPAIAIDLPGHGQRADTLPAEVSVSDYAQAVWQIVSHELQLQRPIVAGHSMGGAIALTLALEHGQELAGLILIGTGARLRVRADLLEATRTGSPEALQALATWSLVSTSSESQRTRFQQELASGAAQLYRDLLACHTFDCMARLGEIQLPTLIVVGAEDQMTPVKYSQYLHNHIAGSTLQIIPAAGHALMQERPEELARVIAAWLAAAPSTPSPGSCYNTASGFPHE